MSTNRIDIARELYERFASADRGAVEQLLSPDFTFSAPPDPFLDRDGYFERCWPGAGSGDAFEFVRLVESGDEVIVTYERTRPDGGAWPQHRGPHLQWRSDRSRGGLLRLGCEVTALAGAAVR
jgi:ketosteroid isomerase-like protein